jgi:hypothetical protein
MMTMIRTMSPPPMYMSVPFLGERQLPLPPTANVGRRPGGLTPGVEPPRPWRGPGRAPGPRRARLPAHEEHDEHDDDDQDDESAADKHVVSFRLGELQVPLPPTANLGRLSDRADAGLVAAPRRLGGGPAAAPWRLGAASSWLGDNGSAAPRR